MIKKRKHLQIRFNRIPPNHYSIATKSGNLARLFDVCATANLSLLRRFCSEYTNEAASTSYKNFSTGGSRREHGSMDISSCKVVR